MICGTIERDDDIMASKIAAMIKEAQETNRRSVIQYGKISSGDSDAANIQNVVDGDVRDAKMVTPFGISSNPPSGLYAQMMENNGKYVCVGTHDPSAPKADKGEVIIYNGNHSAYIKLCADGTVEIKGTKINIG